MLKQVIQSSSHPCIQVELEVRHRLPSVELDGVEYVRTQIASIRRVGPACACGCPSFTPMLDRSVVPSAPADVDGCIASVACAATTTPWQRDGIHDPLRSPPASGPFSR